jgi:hypothetical protein
VEEEEEEEEEEDGGAVSQLSKATLSLTVRLILSLDGDERGCKRLQNMWSDVPQFT